MAHKKAALIPVKQSLLLGQKVNGEIYLCNALLYCASKNNGILGVEDTIFHDLQDDWENCIR